MKARDAIYDRAVDYALSRATKVQDISALPIPIRTVAIVVSAQGVIDNGGLQYFFEADFPNQPPYSLFVEAYREIGADNAALALEQAVALFPFKDPHKHVKKRNEFMERVRSEASSIKDPFDVLSDNICGNEQVWERHRQYVKDNLKSLKK